MFREFCYVRLHAGKLVSSFTELIFMERNVLGLLHVAHRRQNSLYQKLRNLRTVPPPHCAAHKAPLMSVEGMIDLLYGHVLAALIICCHVGDCHWADMPILM